MPHAACAPAATNPPHEAIEEANAVEAEPVQGVLPQGVLTMPSPPNATKGATEVMAMLAAVAQVVAAEAGLPALGLGMEGSAVWGEGAGEPAIE